MKQKKQKFKLLYRIGPGRFSYFKQEWATWKNYKTEAGCAEAKENLTKKYSFFEFKFPED